MRRLIAIGAACALIVACATEQATAPIVSDAANVVVQGGTLPADDGSEYGTITLATDRANDMECSVKLVLKNPYDEPSVSDEYTLFVGPSFYLKDIDFRITPDKVERGTYRGAGPNIQIFTLRGNKIWLGYIRQSILEWDTQIAHWDATAAEFVVDVTGWKVVNRCF